MLFSRVRSFLFPFILDGLIVILKGIPSILWRTGGPPVDLRLHNSTNLVTLVQLSLGFTLIGLVCANQLRQTNLCRKGMWSVCWSDVEPVVQTALPRHTGWKIEEWFFLTGKPWHSHSKEGQEVKCEKNARFPLHCLWSRQHTGEMCPWESVSFFYQLLVVFALGHIFISQSVSTFVRWGSQYPLGSVTVKTRVVLPHFLQAWHKAGSYCCWYHCFFYFILFF